MSILKIRTTEKLENIVKSAVEQMPENATNIRLVDGYRHSVGAFGTHNCWTEVEAVYKDDDGHEVGRVRTIDKIGGWQYRDPANYILYCMGLYVPYNKDNLRSIRARYEGDLDYDRIYPIKNIVSDKYKVRCMVDEIIREDNPEKVTLTYVLDYEYMKNGFRPNVKYDKREYSIRARITHKSESYTFKHIVNFFDATLTLEEARDKLRDAGIETEVNYDMHKKDWEQITSHWRHWWLE